MGLVQNIIPPQAVPYKLLPALCETLIADETLTYAQAETAHQQAKRRNIRLETVLTAEFGLSEQAICAASSAAHNAQVIDPMTSLPDPRLIARYGTENILKHLILPWRICGDATIVLCASADDFAKHRDTLKAYLGPVRMGLATPKQIALAVRAMCDPNLIHHAETQLKLSESSRTWDSRATRLRVITALALLLFLELTWPTTISAIFCLMMATLLLLNTVLKASAAIAGWPSCKDKAENPALPVRLPTITLLVPLFKEVDIAAHLIRRLEALEYPRALLEVCLVLEESDTTTRDTLGKANLPLWIKPVVVPHGTLKTKPRALNYAMTFAQGSIIGVYDAEDAPAKDQLLTVAHHFANCSRDVACLQGTLDYYNPTANWLTRCFTLEYASWFRVILPGFAKLGLVVPLGGTTLFFRRDILTKLGGWDAHNVTEDADLGLRLARHGYRTEFMASVTEEEANGHLVSWVKQRSRWLKGYAITYAVHMRNPLKLWCDLGAWRFFGVQMLFLGTLLQFALAPVIWSFWLIPLGLPHPVEAIAPTWLIWTLAISFIAAGLINIAIYTLGAHRAGKGRLAFWAPTLQLYFPLAVAAVYKGLVELTWKPFYWDKTTHGVLMPDATPPLPPPLHPVSDEQQTPH